MAVTVKESDGLVELRLSRPPVNALDFETVAELERLVLHYTTNLPEKGIVCTGDGKAFCAGVDTRVFAAYSRDRRRDLILAITRVTAAIYQFPRPFVIAVNGHAMGGGFVFMLCGDYRLAVDDATCKLGLTEALAGVPFPAGATEVIRGELPAPLLRQLTMTSRIIGVHELLEQKVLDQLTSASTLLDEARSATAKLASQPAFQTVKQQVRGPLTTRLLSLSANGVDTFIDNFG